MTNLLDRDALLPGDVVLDMTSHRPMQVTGVSRRDAADVQRVWDNDVNQEYYDLDPDENVLELVDVPTGSQYFVPQDTKQYPEVRLGRLLTEPATGDRRVQEKVVRAAMSHLLADVREVYGDNYADAVKSVFHNHWTGEFADEVAEFADTLGPVVEQ
jgi:hypothetical protein